MAIIQTGRRKSWDRDGNLVLDVPWEMDITEEATRDDLHTKGRNALVANKTFLDTPNGSITQSDALVQIKALSRQVNALIRLVEGMEDLLVENDDT
jgi:hypothetical protein